MRLLQYLKLPYNYTQNSTKNDHKEEPRIHNYPQSIIDIVKFYECLHSQISNLIYLEYAASSPICFPAHLDRIMILKRTGPLST